MEKIYFKEKNIKSIIYLDNKKYYGYKYIDNTIKSIDNLHIFKSFLLSSNYTILPKKGKYKVYLDNETGLKHYFHNNIENIKLLFSNNGVYAINYLENQKHLSDTKIFNFNNRLIACTLLGLTLALGSINFPPSKTTDSSNVLINDYELLDIQKMIELSPNLTTEEKKYLYNEEFINDFLLLVNNSYYEKQKLAECFKNINIVGYDDIEHDWQAGYYKIDTPNILYIKNYTFLEEEKKTTIAHEFAHLCQNMTNYNLILEASADIITQEYFYKDYKYSYPTQVKILKKLMEIIGSYPIWYYNFTDDFSMIEERILPYLTDEEYQKFLNDLSFDYNNKEINLPKYKELNEILNNLYYRIYGKDIKDDSIIKLIEREDKNLVRYYFNSNLKDNSYYLDYDNGTYKKISYKEAIERKIITPYTISYLEISKDAAYRIIEDNTYILKRKIDYYSHNISIQYSKIESTKHTITATIDGVKYEEADVDDLAKKGIIDVTYYIIDRKILTSSEYENYNGIDSNIYFIQNQRLIINEDSIEYLEPNKIYLPSVDTRYQINNKYVKKKKITYR